MMLTPVFREQFRPAPTPAGMPLSVRSVGHYRVRPPFLCAVRAKPCLQLFWGVAGRGVMVFDGVEQDLAPNQVALYMPGAVHRWFARDTPWEFRWFTLDGPFALPLAAAFGLRAGVQDAGPAPVTLFRRLHAAVRDPTRRGELRAGALAYHLLALASCRCRGGPDDAVTRALERIHRDWAAPALAIKTLAADLRLHRSSLSRRFKAVTGIVPGAYIARLRVRHALSLLQHSTLPVAEVAAQCGFSDQAYLARVVKRLTHMSPRQVRQRGQPGGARRRARARRKEPTP